VAIENWGISSVDLTWMVKDDNLGNEHLGGLGWVVLGVRCDETSLDILDGQTLDVEADIVTWLSLIDVFVMHFDGFDFSGDSHWSESDDHTGLEDTGLDTTDWYCSNTTNLVHILEWESEWLVSWSFGWVEAVEG